ncbi:MAG: ABC transporter permease [Planctomycetes bacterium]|nr:ABC transporter permease [Planctomycetota bacterium]
MGFLAFEPLALSALALLAIPLTRRAPERLQRIVLPIATAVVLLVAWHAFAVATRYELRMPGEAPRTVDVFPTPIQVLPAFVELLGDGRLVRYAIASLYRVLTGFALAAALGIPLGLAAGWFTRVSFAADPFIQALRPISPLAWIPISILAFGVEDGAAIFIIFLGAFFPIVTGTMTAVRSIPVAYVRAARNFGLDGLTLFRVVVFPAALPQIVTSLRIALGVGWLVVVAAEMNAINSGLGFLIVDARNMGMRYDLVVAGMLCIGLIGVLLDWMIRRLERLDEVRWGFSKV